MITRSLLTLLITLVFAAPLYAGKGAGGGFRYYRTDIAQQLKSASSRLSYQLKKAPEALNNEKFFGKVDLKELADIISRLEIRLDEPKKTRKNPDGFEDVLMLDYRVNNKGQKYIVALEPLFDQITSMVPNAEDMMWFEEELFKETRLESYLRRLLLHEALHHFGFDELKAFELSQLESALTAISYWKSDMADENTMYSWSSEYKGIMTQLTYWARNKRHKENPVTIEFPLSRELVMRIQTTDKGRVAYIENLKYGSLLVAKCQEVKTEQGSVFCDFKKRIVNGKKKTTVNGERVLLYLNNPVLGNASYIDGTYKTERPIRIKYKYKVDENEVLQKVYVPYFNVIKEQKR